MEEYRTGLADVVAGKLDVRAIAAGVSEAVGPEPGAEATDEEDFDEETMDETDAEDVAA